MGEAGPEVRAALLVSETRAQSVPVHHLACWSMDWICRIWVCSFLAVGFLPLVGGAGPDVRAVSLDGRARAQGIMGLVATNWWVHLGSRVSNWMALGVSGLRPTYSCVGLGLGSLMVRRSCVLRNSNGSLFAGEWDCVPA